HIPRQPQPVPPIYEPEVAADAIVWASQHRRRELFVGKPTMVAVEGTKVAPGLADRYLAATFDSQLTEQTVSPDRPDNLFESVPGEYAAHGPFKTDGRQISEQAWSLSSPAAAVLAGAGAVGLGLTALLRKRSS
ncbi:MAG: SDR family oxidoreductase, partial [Terriglobia bacterium]